MGTRWAGAWPLFALSHHLIIWWCAELVYPGRVFTNYAVLGDDVVIADENVATRYKESFDLRGYFEREITNIKEWLRGIREEL